MCSAYLRSDFLVEQKTTPISLPCPMLDTPHPDHPKAVIAGARLPRMRMSGQTEWVPREVRCMPRWKLRGELSEQAPFMHRSKIVGSIRHLIMHCHFAFHASALFLQFLIYFKVNQERLQ